MSFDKSHMFTRVLFAGKRPADVLEIEQKISSPKHIVLYCSIDQGLSVRVKADGSVKAVQLKCHSVSALNRIEIR